MPVRKDGVLGGEAGQYHGGAGCLLWCEEQQSLESKSRVGERGWGVRWVLVRGPPSR